MKNILKKFFGNRVPKTGKFFLPSGIESQDKVDEAISFALKNYANTFASLAKYDRGEVLSNKVSQ